MDNRKYPLESENLVDVNVRKPLQLGLAIVVFGVGGFLAWSLYAPLDAGVVADGTVTVSNDSKTVQHLTGGRVLSIAAKNGERVGKNQVLVTLDKTQIEMRYSALSAQYLVAKSIEDRLKSERNGLKQAVFSEQITQGYANNPRLNEVLSLQDNLFKTRTDAVQGELAMLDESVAGLSAQIESLLKVRQSREQQFELINQELAAVRKLSDKDYFPKAQMMALEREAAGLSGAISEDILNISKLKSELSAVKLKRHQYLNQYQKEVESELTSQQKEVATLEDEITVAKHDLHNTLIRSPIDGVIMDVKVHTVGAVIQPGQTLMSVVPQDQPLQIDAKIPVQAIDKLAAGLRVDIIFPALNHALLPSIPGSVITISADRLVDEISMQPYYLAEIQVSAEGKQLLDSYQIKAGMPASVTIKTGERTMMNYLLKPFMARLQLAFKET